MVVVHDRGSFLKGNLWILTLRHCTCMPSKHSVELSRLWTLAQRGNISASKSLLFPRLSRKPSGILGKSSSGALNNPDLLLLQWDRRVFVVFGPVFFWRLYWKCRFVLTSLFSVNKKTWWKWEFKINGGTLGSSNVNPLILVSFFSAVIVEQTAPWWAH